ncbi:MAG: ribosome silencing factor [Alphaproteobacteria bacterium]|nr:ribosome silencing factor [Alphaproteobacteria bacterium]
MAQTPERRPGPRASAAARRSPGADAVALAEAEPAAPSLDATVLEALVRVSLEDDKAEDILSFDIRGKSSVADMLIVASGRSQRHVGALADHVVRRLKEAGVGQVRVEGLPHCDWVLVDAGDLVVHLFRPEVRSFYAIEKIWSPTKGAPASA